MTRSRWQVLVAMVVAGAVAWSGLVPAAAADPGGSGEAPAVEGRRAADGARLVSLPMTYLRSASTPAIGRVAPRDQGPARVSTARSTFVVTYHGFPAPARAAFQRAVDLWSTLVASNVPIRIDAHWRKLDPGVLGGASPADGYVNGTTVWPIAVANAKAGRDLSPEPDITAVFASSGVPWYYGTDGRVPSDRLDLTTVVLHEIGHGLSFAGTTYVEGSRGYWGGGGTIPSQYDAAVEDHGGKRIRTYANGSTALGTVLRSGAVYFGGAQAKAANGGTKVRLYAPNPYEQGSSISHLDEATYRTGTANSLMTPFLDDGEALHDPGDVGLAVMRDLGWVTAGPAGVSSAPAKPAVIARQTEVDVRWTTPIDTGRTAVTGYRVEAYVAGSGTPSATVYDVPVGTLRTIVRNLEPGTSLRFTVRVRNRFGFGARSPLSDVVVPRYELSPFESVDGVIEAQYRSFQGRVPNALEYAYWRPGLNAGTTSIAETVAGIASLPASADPYHRLTRLYSAYFRRLPDYGGLTYWVGKQRSGTPLAKASDTFAASSEFVRTYGSLSNRAFVTLIYDNVLGRASDPGGLDYWSGRLDRGVQSRGSVMLGFSESAEHVRLKASVAGSVLLRAGMLRRMPTADELASDVALLDGGAPLADLAALIIPTFDYCVYVCP